MPLLRICSFGMLSMSPSTPVLVVCICVCVCVSVFVYVCVWVCVQLRYTWDSKLMRGLMSSVTETPEIVLARENAKNFSDVSVHFAQRGHHSL